MVMFGQHAFGCVTDASPCTGLVDTEPTAIDPVKLREKRLERVREVMRDLGLDGCLLLDPFNQRYATGSRNMLLYFLRNATRYIYVPQDGPIVLFEYPGSAHVSTRLETIDEARSSKLVWSSVMAKDGDTVGAMADEIVELLKIGGVGTPRVGIDRCSFAMGKAFESRNCEVVEFHQDLLQKRAVKLPEEIACLKISMAATEMAVHAVREAIKPGVSEQYLFSLMFQKVIEQGGDYIKTRLLSAGQRTNPWFNEASPHMVRAGDLIGLDTDTIGCFGYYSDFSRTFHCGPGKPSGYQKSLYRLAYEQVHHNMSIVKPGMSYREVADKAWKIPEKFVEQRYSSVIHGVGMHGEAPQIAHAIDFDEFGNDGIVKPGMVMAVESYIGEVGGAEGVKLEEEVLVTETGVERISTYPFEDDLLERHI